MPLNLLFIVALVFFCFIPITIEGKSTIPLNHIVNYVLQIPYFREIYGVILVTIGAILPFHRKTWNKDFQTTVFSVLKILQFPLFSWQFRKRP